MLLRKTITLFVVLGLIFSVELTGCSLNNSITPNNPITTSQASGKNAVIRLWTHKTAYYKGFKAVADAYKDKNGITVSIEVFEGDDPYKEKLAAAAHSKSLPDIYVVWASIGNSFPGEFDKNTVLEMTNKVDETWKKTFLPNAWKDIIIRQSHVDQWKKDFNTSATIKAFKVGQFYGVPLDVGSFFMIYGNKKIVESAGLEVEAPKTWEDFIELMKTIKANTGTPGLVYGAKLSDVWWNWAGSALETMANGETGYRNLLLRKERMSEPQNLRVISALNNAIKANVIMDSVLDMNIEQADRTFANHKAAFDLGGSFTMSNLIEMGMKPEDIFTFPIPPLKNSKYTEWKVNPFTLLQMRVPTYTKHQKEALDFIRYMTSIEGALIFESATFDVSAVDLSSVQDKRLPAMRDMYSLFTSEEGYLANIDENPVNYRANNEWRIIDTGSQDLLRKTTTPEEIAKVFDAQMNAEIAREAAIAAAKH